VNPVEKDFIIFDEDGYTVWLIWWGKYNMKKYANIICATLIFMAFVLRIHTIQKRKTKNRSTKQNQSNNPIKLAITKKL